MCIFHIHKWTRWEQYMWVGIVYPNWLSPDKEPRKINERRQRRHCVKCGKEQDELV